MDSVEPVRRKDPSRRLPVHIVRMDNQFQLVYASPSALDWFGLSPDQQTGRPIRELIGHEDFAALKPWLDTALSGVHTDYSGGIRYACGGDRQVDIMLVPCHGEGERVVGLELVTFDATERLATRARLADEMLRSHTLVQHATEGLITIDTSGIIRSFNPAAERIFGYEAAEVIGCSAGIFMPHSHQSRPQESIRYFRRALFRHGSSNMREVLALHRDGSLVPVRLAASELFLNQQQHFICFVQDLSEREEVEQELAEMQENLAHADRVTAMGELASGLAHEISQPLTAIQATAEACSAMLASGIQDSARLLKAMNDVAQQSRRAGDIVQELRAFVRKGEPQQLSRHAPLALLPNVLLLLAGELKKANVRVEVNAEGPPCDCRLNRIQIEQVFVNLIRNATEAIKTSADQGVIEVRGRYREDLGCCEVEVEDSGPGILPEDAERIFTPFFTTKGHGLGQGLAICRSIVERHGGTMDVTEGMSGGSVFRFTLPVGDPDKVDNEMDNRGTMTGSRSPNVKGFPS